MPVMMALVIIEVITRYVLRHPLMLADEFSAYMLVGLAFIGLAYTWREKGHVRIEALISRLPIKVSQRLRVATLLIALGYALMLTKVSYDYLAFSFKTHMRSETWLMTPMQVPHMTLAIGFGLLSMVLITEIVKAIRAIKG